MEGEVELTEVVHACLQRLVETNLMKIGNREALDRKIDFDPGLFTIKMATIFSYDILNKIKDTQSFVQWMQLLNSLYEVHATACVWLLKYLT